MSNNSVLVTGASGFIGKALVKALCQNGYNVIATVRSECGAELVLKLKTQFQLKKLSIYNLGELTTRTDWSAVIKDVHTIIHCAARAHVLHETSTHPLKTFRQINCEATEHLAIEAAHLGVKRFVFISSIGVLGNSSYATPFTDISIPNPQVPYAQAKWEAEQSLEKLSDKMEIVIIRPPLIYGPGVKGNFEKLLSLVDKGIPLPFGSVKNKRQFLGIYNLIDFIMVCMEAPKAANQVFLVTDKEIVSTTQLIRLISIAMGKNSILLPIPHKLLEYCIRRIGKVKLAEQLLNNLEINANKTKTLLNWEPPYTMKQQLQQTIDHHIGKKLD